MTSESTGSAQDGAMSSTDGDWEHFAQNDPYFYVVTEEKYKNANLNKDSIAEFYARGQSHIERVLRVLNDHFGPSERPRVSLDFGCGVGRLVFPLARISERAIGVDVSDTMLEIAAQNAKRFGIDNIV